MELDVFLPSLSLAFEYQGIQHYQDTVVFGFQKMYQDRDIMKRTACLSSGITLIDVPYWWNRETDSLVATIHRHRPDLLPSPNGILPIPTVKPLEKDKTKQIV